MQFQTDTIVAISFRDSSGVELFNNGILLRHINQQNKKHYHFSGFNQFKSNQ